MGENVWVGESLWTGILLLFLGHALGDFYLQSKNTVRKKEKKFPYLIMHAIIYTLCLTALLLITCQIHLDLAWLIPLIFVTHALIDMAKCQAEKVAPRLPLLKTKQNVSEFLFFIDQGLHIGTLVLWAFLFSPYIIPQPWFTNLPLIDSVFKAGTGEGIHPAVLLTALVCVVRPASIIIEKIMIICDIQPTVDTGFPNGGKVIGILERLLVFFLLLMGQFSTIGLVVAAKSLARFRDLDDRKCAEYYIIGTFLSLVTVGAVALIMFAASKYQI